MDPTNLVNNIEGIPPLNLVIQLCKAIDLEGIIYCHWKSNAAIDLSASGDNDLDLLVKRSNIQQFREILSRLGFKECLADKFKQLPGVQDFIGYDLEAEKFIHVHAHYQLIFGHDLSKNYHLPIEKPYLDSVQHSGLFKVPAPEYELVVFVIRMIIKHSTWDTILLRDGALSLTEKQELIYLETKADPAKVAGILEQHLPFIDADFFDECLRTLRPGCPLLIRILTGRHLNNRLKAHSRRSQVKDLIIKLWRRTNLIIQWRVKRKNPGFHLDNGGAIVAIIGGDGAGKTTAIDELFTWLSRRFDTNKTHMGKPSFSKTTNVIRIILKIGEILHFYSFEKALVQYGENQELFDFPGFLWLIRQVCTARDRFLTYKRARCFASNGGIVLCDRYHIQQIRFMESPNTSIRMTNLVKNHWLVKFLIRVEKKYYQQILLPEILIVLRLDPELAVQRKREADVHARSTEIWEFNWEENSTHVIDASQPVDVVASKIKSLVWSEL